MAVKIQHLRSSTADKRPTTTALLDGELSINTNAGSSGVFFEDAAGNIVKVGPAEIGSAAPNASPPSGGSAGNSAGEFWFDTANAGGNAEKALKIYDGTSWEYVGKVTIGSTDVTLGGAAVTTFAGLSSITSADINATATIDLDNQADLRFYEATANGSNYVGFQAPASITADVLWTLPAADGTSNQVLSTNGSGTLQWNTISTNSITQGDSAVTVTDTGSDGTVTFRTDGVDRWVINSSGHLVPFADSTYNLGAPGTEVLNVYADNLYGTLQTASQTNITAVGTLTGGTWNATTIAVAHGGTGLTTTPTNGQLLIGNGTGYTLSTLTAGTNISVTDGSGSITIATGGAVASSFAGDSGTAAPAANVLTIAGGTGLTSAATGSTVTLNLDNTAVSPASYGSGSQVATFTVDAQGRLTSAANATIGITASQVSDFDTQVRTSRLDQMAAPTSSVSFNSQLITNLAAPLADTDAANKGYVDSVAQGLDVKQSVRAATTVDITLSGAQTIDGVSVIASDRVLVKNQSAPSENGIYVAAAGAWTRSLDMDQGPEFPGSFFFVEEGTVNANNGFVCTTNSPVTIGTTAITFEQFSGAGQVIAGDGLTKTGNTLDVGGTTDRISVTASAVDIASTYVGQTSITTLGTITTGTWNATVVGTAYGGTGVDNTNISQNFAFIGPNSGGPGAATFREILTSDVAPVTGGSFDAGTF
jgi:hypothetical protein